LVTKSKEDSLVNRRYLTAKLAREASVKKLLELVGPIFKERNGGYTRIIKLPPRRGDSAEMAVLEFVENVSEVAVKKKLKSKELKAEKNKATTTKEATKKDKKSKTTKDRKKQEKTTKKEKPVSKK
jgi:large subunit ribosomal protein L17